VPVDWRVSCLQEGKQRRRILRQSLVQGVNLRIAWDSSTRLRPRAIHPPIGTLKLGQSGLSGRLKFCAQDSVTGSATGRSGEETPACRRCRRAEAWSTVFLHRTNSLLPRERADESSRLARQVSCGMVGQLNRPRRGHDHDSHESISRRFYSAYPAASWRLQPLPSR
jgi:hypothetical protein